MNESAPLQRGSDRLWLVGCDDLLAGDFDLERALGSLPSADEPRFLLMHNPQSIESIAHHGFDLVLSGHTHGGQISLPFVPPKVGSKYLAGLFYVGASRLYVCRGTRSYRRSDPFYDNSRNRVLPPCPFFRGTVNNH